MKNIRGGILITGASEGIGAAIAEKLLERGSKVIMVARRRELMEALAAKHAEEGSGYSYTADLSDPENAEKIFSRILEEHSDITAAVHNAGSAVFGRVDELALTDWRRVMDLNLTAAFIMAKILLPRFRKAGGGHFVFMNSVAHRDIFPGGNLYGTGKAALKAFADQLREEVRPDGIAVTSIYPGAVATPWWGDSDFDRGSMIQPEDLAEQVLNVIDQPRNAVIEDLVIRRVQGNF